MSGSIPLRLHTTRAFWFKQNDLKEETLWMRRDTESWSGNEGNAEAYAGGLRVRVFQLGSSVRLRVGNRRLE